MTKEEKQREKELRQLIYVRNQLIKEYKKELKAYRDELLKLGDNKKLVKRRKI